MQNFNPIFTRVPNVSADGLQTSSAVMGCTLTTQAADYTGANANNKLVWTAGADGGFIERLRFKALGTNIVTVARVYLNNGGVNTTAANNLFIGEVTLPATTAATNAATVDIDYPLGFGLDPNFRIFVGLGVTVAAGWVVSPLGAGKY